MNAVDREQNMECGRVWVVLRKCFTSPNFTLILLKRLSDMGIWYAMTVDYDEYNVDMCTLLPSALKVEYLHLR